LAAGSAAKSPTAGVKAGQPLAVEAPAADSAAPTTDSAGSGPPGAAARDIRSLLTSLKFPGGELSASILSFAKFFSLPLDGPSLGKVRRRALSGPDRRPGNASPPASGFQFREALALAALASAAKGLELNSEALAAYARALLHGQVPPEDRNAGTDDPAGRATGKAGDSGKTEAPPAEGPVEAAGVDAPGDEGSGAGNFGGEEGGSGGKGTPGEAGGAFGEKDTEGGEIRGDDPAAGIRELALAAQEPLLDILNRLPGKDGKRWIVLPFSLEGLDICLRVLLAGSRAELMGLDLRDGEGVWRFIFRPGDPSSGEQKTGQSFPWFLEICQSPASGDDRTGILERELPEFLGIPAGMLRIRWAPVFADSRDWILPSINEEV
jgi:hypothetical protein